MVIGISSSRLDSCGYAWAGLGSCPAVAGSSVQAKMHIRGIYYIMFAINILSQSALLRQSLRFQLRMLSSPDSSSIFFSKKTMAEIGLNP
ncbi:hypothetical protein EON65_52075, partial [archaeon]